MPKSNQNLWTAAATGDLKQVRKFVAVGWPLDEPDPFFLQTSMAWAIYHDHPEVVAELIVKGADPNAGYGERDLDTHLHSAAFFGRSECAQLLLEAGADAAARNGYGETPRDSMSHGQEVVSVLAEFLKVQLDFDEVLAGREEVRAMLDGRESDNGRADSGLAARPGWRESQEGRSPGISWRGILMGLMHFPFFHHLWFLWLLVWLVAGLALAGTALGALRLRPSVPWWLVGSPLALVWLVPLTALTQSVMFAGIVIPGFGPDTSGGLLPIPHVVAYSAIFFAFGAMVTLRPERGFGLEPVGGSCCRWL